MELAVTYDKEADAAYFCLARGQPAARQVEAVCGAIILDFDADDRLIGIEILSASRVLPAGFCEGAEQLPG